MSWDNIFNFDEATHMQVLREYLVNGCSYRKIQREILELPSPARGGGYVAMGIVHHYGFKGSDKGTLKDLTEVGFSGETKKVKDYIEIEDKTYRQIKENNFNYEDENTELTANTKIRVKQNVLRRVVLDNYKNKCALCDVDERSFLRCSHIIPWAVDIENRLNPANAICLCVMHDALFELGFISFNNDFSVVVAKKIPKTLLPFTKELIFNKPQNNVPDSRFLDYHRQNKLRQ